MITTKLVNARQCRCITTGMEPRSFAQSTITGYLHEAGFRIALDGSAAPFYLNETVTAFNAETKREEVYLVLPEEERYPLLTMPDTYKCGGTGPAEARVRQIYRLFSALLEAVRKHTVPADVFRAVLAAPVCLLTDAEGTELTVLPPQLLLRCVTASPEAGLRFHYPWVHPGSGSTDPAEAAAFFLAALSYTMLSGIPPFGADTNPFARHEAACVPAAGSQAVPAGSGSAEQLIQNMRDGAFIPIELYCPTLDPAYTAVINRSLELRKQPEEGRQLAEQLCAYRDKNLPVYTTDEDKAAAIKTDSAARTAFIEKKRRQIMRKRFVIKKRGTIAALTAALLIVCSASAAIIVKISRPPETAGLSAQAVIYGFYDAVGTLDQAKITAYTKNKAGAEYENLMVHLFVTEKMREVYEQKKIYYSPEDFALLCSSIPAVFSGTDSTAADSSAANGTPAESAAQFKKAVTGTLRGGSVYGISQLTIVPQTGVPAPEQHTAEWIASFYYWIPLLPAEKTEELLNSPQADISGFFPVQVFHYRDSITLTEAKGSLFIGSVTPLERTLIVPSSTELLEACMPNGKEQPDYLKNGAPFYGEQFLHSEKAE
ncbi:MAG: hypothetical protein P1P65_07055 [Treponema sp.]